MSRRYVCSALHVVNSLDEKRGGSVRAALDVSKGLVNAGVEVEIATTVGPGDALEFLRMTYAELRIQRFDRRFPTHNFRSPDMRRWLVEHVRDYDVVEIHQVFSFVSLYAGWACRRVGMPYTVRPHGSLDMFDVRKHAAFKRLYGWLLIRPLLARASCVITTSELEAERLVTYGAHPRRVVMPLPVEKPTVDGNGSRFRARYSIPTDACVVLFLGRIDEKKGLECLIPSVAEIRKSFPSVWFVLAGTGESHYLRRVAGLLAEQGISPWTTVTGFVAGEEKADIFEAADIFALPSRNENFGIAIIEAMYAGIALLLSEEVYIHRELVRGGAAVACTPDLDGCLAGLHQLVASKEDRERMGSRGRELAERSFRTAAPTEALVRLYAELAG